MYFMKITLDMCFVLKTKWRDNVDKDRKIICPLAEDSQHV